MRDLNIRVDDSAIPRVAVIDGPLDHSTAARAFSILDPYFRRGEPLILDVGGVERIDSAGVALLAHGFKALGAQKDGCALRSTNAEVERALKLTGWDFTDAGPPAHAAEPGFAESVGAAAMDVGQGAMGFVRILSEAFYFGIVAPLRGKKLHRGSIVEQMSRLGAGSAPIVLLVALLVGLTTAFQSAYQIRRFGADIYIADLVAISMMVELGPLMAGILVAGRSGAAITAEIGTMKVSEEIDALRVMGINPVHYLAVPRMWAAVVTQPLLGVSAAVVGILGGFLVAVGYLELSAESFVHGATKALVLGDLVRNITKSIVFGAILSLVGVYYGLSVGGGAAGVGRATTQSVVTSILMIIAADCVFSFI